MADSKTLSIALALLLIGWGITLHAVANELFRKGGISDIFKFQGEWFGLAIIFIGIILILHYFQILRLLKKVPDFVWKIIAVFTLSEALFWSALLQMDSMIFQIAACGEQNGYDRMCEWLWIPEFGISYKNSWILFFSLAVIGYHLLVILIIWLLAEKLRARQT